MLTKMSPLLTVSHASSTEERIMTCNYCGFRFVLNLGKTYLEFVGVKPKVAVFENV